MAYPFWTCVSLRVQLAIMENSQLQWKTVSYNGKQSEARKAVSCNGKQSATMENSQLQWKAVSYNRRHFAKCFYWISWSLPPNHILSKRPGCYHSARKTYVRDMIFKLSLIHDSVISSNSLNLLNSVNLMIVLLYLGKAPFTPKVVWLPKALPIWQ